MPGTRDAGSACRGRRTTRLARARRTISIDSSNTSRLSSSSAAWSGLSCEPIDTPLSLRCSTSRGTVPRPTPRMPRPPDRLCSVEKSSARRIGFHCGTTLNIVPSADPLGAGGDPRRDHDPVRDDLVALVLEVVLGRPERVVAEPLGLDRRVDVVRASPSSRPRSSNAGPSGSGGPAPASSISTPPKKNAPSFIASSPLRQLGRFDSTSRYGRTHARRRCSQGAQAARRRRSTNVLMIDGTITRRRRSTSTVPDGADDGVDLDGLRAAAGGGRAARPSRQGVPGRARRQRDRRPVRRDRGDDRPRAI